MTGAAIEAATSVSYGGEEWRRCYVEPSDKVRVQGQTTPKAIDSVNDVSAVTEWG